MPMNDELLRVKGLFYSLGEDKTMLSNLSFSIQEGSFTLLCGPNGAGKSTLLRILKGLYPLEAGTIVLEGKDVTKREKDRLRKIGLVFRTPTVNSSARAWKKTSASGWKT